MSETLQNRELSPSLEATEDAIVAALQADAVIAGYIADLGPFQGTLEQALQETSFRDPSMLVLFAGFDADPFGQVDHEIDMEWHIIVRSRNLRGNTPRQVPGAPGETGTYQMVADVLRVLTGRLLDLDGLGALVPAGTELLTASANKDRSLSAYTVVFRATAELRVVEGEQALEQVAADYQVGSGDTFTSLAADEMETTP